MVTMISTLPRIAVLALLALASAGCASCPPTPRSDPHAPRTLVLVHGNFDSRATWDRALPMLEPHFRVVALDLPGFGAAPNPSGAYGVDALAGALREALVSQGVRRAVFVGNSLGGAVVAALAAAHPEDVEGLVLEDANLVSSHPTEEMGRLLGRVLAVSAADTAALTSALEPALRLALPTPGAVDAALVRHFATGLDAAHRPELDRQRAAFSLHRLLDRLVEARAAHPFPVLVLWGVNDPLVPVRAAERFLPRLTGARAVFFAGTGHAPHLERPREFAATLVAAFAGPAVKLPDDDLILPDLAGSLPSEVDIVLPRLHGARTRALGLGSHPAQEPAPTATPATGPALEATCEAGALGDCFHLARMILTGYAPRPDGVADHARGFALLVRACRGELAVACTMRATWDTGLEPAQAARFLTRACNLGHAEGCYERGLRSAAGRGVMPDAAQAQHLYDRACALGEARGCKERDVLAAAPARERAFVAEHEAACRGPGPSKDLREQINCQVVARAYLEGRGVPADPARAAAILMRDCDVASATGGSCGDLAPLLANGTGVVADPEAALRIDRALCAQDRLGHCLRLGLAVAPTDPAEAARLFARATQVSDYALELARVLMVGRPGVKGDPLSLLRLACAGGKGEACVLREELL